ncbi:hypothetical protein PR202_gb08596 [Eleusine coracana subsp. coracana]|uniref:LSM domain-containing protein n=1 Tax=Eleusine coracana subsp. coracana TaxID=191504 RepID=A0AAV5EFZ1_ELECO|nr:hypothetical protein PR202_gb08596 [Eleusine coracana subsp. coracana]
MSSGGGSDKSGSAGGSGGAVKTPSDFLKSIRGRPVVVKLNSGVDYRGSPLSCSLENSDNCLLNAVLYISTSKRTLTDGA